MPTRTSASFRTILGVLLVVSIALGVSAQETPWSAPVRGTWVQSAATQAGDVVLADHGSGCEIAVGAGEKSNVRLAAEFLAGDIEKITGYRPPIVATADGHRCSIRLVTLGHGDIPREVGASALQGQWESYRVVTLGNVVWLVGANPRGTAFAAYTLSERLGIDPLYIWTGYAPEHRDPLILKRTEFAANPPSFRYRGFFHDDEDILPRPFDDRGYPLQTGDVPLDWYKRFFETALRLRLNMVAPYVRVHRRFEVQKLASDWGLYYTSHHYDTLLSNPFGLTRFNLAAERGVKPEWNWFTNRDGMLTYWRDGVLENRELDAIWPVGMRGTEDRPFVFPEGTTDAQKAQTFREVIHEQVEMTRELVPKDKPPIFHFTMFNEMLPQYQKNPGAFDLPADVIIVWPDDNDGHMRGLPAGLGKWKHGVYYHLAFLGGNLTKQLTHTVPPSTVAEQFDKIVKSGATEFMLLNVSELRDYVMTARMVAEITWDAPAIYSQPDAAERYTRWWAREYFEGPVGTNASADVEAAYGQYFSLLNTPDTMWSAEETVQDLLEQLYHKMAGEAVQPVAPEKVAALRSRAPLLDAALAAEARAERALPMSRRRFLHEDVALGLIVDQKQTQAALKLNDALSADPQHMWPLVMQAREPLEELEIELMRGEYPPFDRWYHETWIRPALGRTNPHRSYNQLRAFIASEGHGHLEKMPPPPVPPPRPRP
jgi:hypothetical protein